jgi:hypothetical protein
MKGRKVDLTTESIYDHLKTDVFPQLNLNGN